RFFVSSYVDKNVSATDYATVTSADQKSPGVVALGNLSKQLRWVHAHLIFTQPILTIDENTNLMIIRFGTRSDGETDLVHRDNVMQANSNVSS
ncbi:MAG: hypothetical protein VYC38_14405, partial [Pseudomonadota bacterium]|nr:hypothetical protein [Pseudomonadota bacterium]